MALALRIRIILTIGLLASIVLEAQSQTFRASFDKGLKADHAVGRSEPWVSLGTELVAGKFGKAVQIGPKGQLIYAADQNFQAGRGTLACWCRIPERPGPLDIQRIVFVQSKERGYWTYLAALEWQESVFRAMVFDYYHGHGWHDPSALPSLKAGEWHHVALAWDHAAGTKFYLDGKLLGSTWGKQAWWDRPTPHAIHLSWVGAAYDEVCVYDHVLEDAEVAGLAKDNHFKIASKGGPPVGASARRLIDSLAATGLASLPSFFALEVPITSVDVIRQTRVRHIMDDKIPAWKIMDGRMNLFWPEWRAPVLGDVDFSGSELNIGFAKGEKPTHLLMRGLVGGCQIHGERGEGFVSRTPMIEIPAGQHFLAAARLPAGQTGLNIPRREGMKIQELGLFELDGVPKEPGGVVTSLSGEIELESSGTLVADMRTLLLPHERRTFGKASTSKKASHAIPGLTRINLVTEPVVDAMPLDAVSLQLKFSAPWEQDVWWVRIQDPVNPRRDLMHVPIRVVNAAPGKPVTFHVHLDHWDIMLDAKARLWVELLPTQEFNLITGGDEASHVALVPGNKERVLAEFGHTQSQLAYSYWLLGSEANGTVGSNPEAPGFALLGSITHNRELKLTMEWVRRHVPDQPLVNSLWNITYAKRNKAPVKPRLQPANAPEWAIWGRELLERFRHMAHHWADRQGPDGQIGGGWNDDTDLPGVFICLPLLGDHKTQKMFERIYDGLEKTGYLSNGVIRGPSDPLHATDFLSWRAHLMLFDYGQPRHIERALNLTHELKNTWTALDKNGQRRFRASFFSEDGPSFQPNSEINSAGLIRTSHAGEDSSTNRNYLRDSLFCAWYSRNPSVLKFLHEIAEADYADISAGKQLGNYGTYPFYSYFTLFGDQKYLDEPVDRLLRDRWSLPIWRRFAERLPKSDRLDAQLLKQAKVTTASDEQLATAYLISRDKAHLSRAFRNACEELQGGWQFRGGEAGGANDHFNVPGQASLSQMYLGSAMAWVRPASILPPIAVSWQGLDSEVAAIVLEANAKKLRVAIYNFENKPRPVNMRLWELAPGTYRLREGLDADHDDRIDAVSATRELTVQRGTPVELLLPAQRVHIVEIEQIQARPRPELLPDLAVGTEDVYYDKATDRLKVNVHNLGAAAAEKIVVRFEDGHGNLLGERVIPRLEAPLDLQPKTAIVWLPQPLLHPGTIQVRIDPLGRIEEITRANNQLTWRP